MRPTCRIDACPTCRARRSGAGHTAARSRAVQARRRVSRCPSVSPWVGGGRWDQHSAPPASSPAAPRGSRGGAARRLRGAGHDAVHVPLVAVEPVGDGLSTWMATTGSCSPASSGTASCAGGWPVGPVVVAAIGAATAEAFGGADLVAERRRRRLLAVMPQPAGRVLFAGAEGVRRLLPEALGPTSSCCTARSR